MPTPVISTTTYEGWFIGRTMTESDTGSNLITETYLIRKKGGGGGEPPLPMVPTNYVLLDPTAEIDTLHTEDVFPNIGEEYETWAPSGTTPLFGGSCYCVGTEVVCNKDGSITATHTFISRRKWDPASWSTPAQLFLPEVEFLTTQRQAEEFRQTTTTLTVTAPPSTSDKSASDISGAAIKVGAETGIVTTYNQIRMRIRRHFEKANCTTAKFIEHFTPFIGTRNNATFMGFTEQTLSFDGFNMVKVEGPFYEVVFDFTYDEKFFHSQYPEYDVDGVPKMNATGTEFSDVRWRRSSTEEKDFNQIFFSSISGSPTSASIDTDMQAIAETGYW